MANFTRKYPAFDPNTTQTNDAISNHIEEIAQIYEHLNGLRKANLTDGPEGSIIIHRETDDGRLEININGTFKTITPMTSGVSPPSVSEIQEYHLHYFPDSKILSFYKKTGKNYEWIDLYPKSETASVSAIPIANSNNQLDTSWCSRYNPIPLSQHQTEENKIILCKGDRAYLDLNGNDNPIYIKLDTGERQLFNIFIEWYNSTDSDGCYLVPNSTGNSKQSGWQADKNQSRYPITGTTDKIYFGSGARGIAMANITFALYCYSIICSVSANSSNEPFNLFIAHNGYENLIYFGSIKGGSNLKGRVLIEKVW